MVGKAHYELFRDKLGKIRFRLKAPNGKIICASEAYESTRNAKIGIASLQKFAGSEIQEDLR